MKRKFEKPMVAKVGVESPTTPLASECLDQLPVADVRLAQMHLEGVPWKVICTHFEISRSTASRRMQYMLAVAAWRSSGRALPESWSRRYLLSRLRLLSTEL